MNNCGHNCHRRIVEMGVVHRPLQLPSLLSWTVPSRMYFCHIQAHHSVHGRNTIRQHSMKCRPIDPTILRFYTYLVGEHGNRFKHAMGNTEPPPTPITDEYWLTRVWSTETIIGLVVRLVRLRWPRHQVHTPLVIACIADANFIHLMRLTGHFIRTTWIKIPYGANESTNVMIQCAQAIVYSIERHAIELRVHLKRLLPITSMCREARHHRQRGGNLPVMMRPLPSGIGTVGQLHSQVSRRSAELIKRLSRIACGTHARHDSLPSAYRHTFLHKYYTRVKQTAFKLSSDLVTERWKRAACDPTSYVSQPIKPADNYAKRLAILELVMHGITMLKIPQLLTVIDMVMNAPTKYTEMLAYDTEYINLLTLLYTTGRARFRTKFLRLNENGCTCHTKCTGPLGNNRDLEKRIYGQSLSLHAQCLICGICRLSPFIENTTREKPRMCLSSKNPAIDTCSLDGSSSFKVVPLYELSTQWSDGKPLLQYQHLAYTTNSVNMADELLHRPYSGRRSRIYGICFGGYRTCKQRYTVDSTTARNRVKQITSYKDVGYWFRCPSCMSSNRDYGPHSSLALSDVEPNTCIARVFTISVPLTAGQMCRGCKAAVFCHHLDSYLCKCITDKNFSAAAIYRRIRLLERIRRELLGSRDHWD